MKGKTIVATGATSGIGEAAVLALAGFRRSHRLHRARRRARAGDDAQDGSESAGARPSLHLADLSSMAETRQVGAAIAASEPRIDVLINNAGALFSHRQVTPEGLERTFALNHMAYFVLTEALREKLIASAPARDRLHFVLRPSARDASISTTCRALRAITGSRSTAARSSPISCSPASSPGAWPAWA